MRFRLRTIGALCIAAGLVASAYASAEASPSEIGVALRVTPPPATYLAESTSTTATPAVTTTSTAPPVAPDPHRTWIATAKSHVTSLEAFDEPDGSRLVLPFNVSNPHQFGGPLTLMVTEGARGDEWVRVQLPVRPNGQQGWINTADYTISATSVRAEVILSQTLVRVYDRDELIAESQAVIGKADTPTPLGTFYIAAKKPSTEDEYFLGPWALVLSSFSEVLSEFSGGLPVIAVHGTHRPDQVGEAITFGCVRVPNDVIDFLAENVPLGAPVVISA